MIYLEHRNDATGIANLLKEYSPSACILHTKRNCACDVISMFKINYTITFHGISVNQQQTLGLKTLDYQFLLFLH